MLNSRPPISKATASVERRKCECGYDPFSAYTLAFIRTKDEIKIKNKDEETCPVNLPLGNHITFPSLKMLPKTDEVKELFYNSHDGFPKRHWCLLVELNEKIKEDKTSKIWSGYTVFGENIKLVIESQENEKPTQFDWSDLKQGNTVAILYATAVECVVCVQSRHVFKAWYVFKTGISNLQFEATKLLINADLSVKKIPQKCFGCGDDNKMVSSCAKCLLAKYCTVECQRKCWLESHKNMCSQMETLLRLASLQRHPFSGYLVFEANQKDSLPSYTYNEEFSTLNYFIRHTNQ